MVAAVVLGVDGRVKPPRRTPDFRYAAPAGSSLNLSWFTLYQVFITMTGGREASDKYHKEGEKSGEPHKPTAPVTEKAKKPAPSGTAPQEAGLRFR
jgi:hypothetical protein